MGTGPAKRLAVLGRPVSHSLSPRMHTAALSELGLGQQWSYEAVEVAPEDLAGLLARMPAQGFVGANVTIPHKTAALALAERASDAASAIGAANTLSFGPGGVRADNTDAPGLIAALPEPPARQRALVIGAGGAARAAAWALAQAGAEVEIWNRTRERAAELAAEFGVGALQAGAAVRLDEYELVLNATSIGLEAASRPAGAASSEDDAIFKLVGASADQLGERQVVVDLVYGKTETGLIRTAEEAGARTVDGLEILVRQGAASLEIWTGLSAPLATMREAVRPRHS